jgi:hypothetical protein
MVYNKEAVVISPQLDDRMGVFILLDVLPELGIHPDVLLTVGEESCASTAANFEPKKKYNWGFSFDRRGDDVVLYQYGYAAQEWRTSLEIADFTMGYGSYSDIKELDALGCKFANIGCGYYNEHSDYCYAVLQETCEQIERFMQFFQAFENTRFPHIRTEYGQWGRYDDGYYRGHNYGRYDTPVNSTRSYGVEVRWCRSCGCTMSSEEVDMGFNLCLICIGNEESRSWEKDGEYYYTDSNDETYNSNGLLVCRECQVELYPHEETSGLCDDCTQFAQKEARDEDKSKGEE